MARRREFRTPLLGFPRGRVGLVSDLAQRPDYVRVAENVIPEPTGAFSVRPGTQRATSQTLGYEPHSLLEWVSSSGASNKYVATNGGHLYRMTPSALVAQTVPITLGSAEWLSWCEANGALFATELGGANGPIFYRQSNTAETWLPMAYPTPAASLTLTNAAGGAVPTGTHYYRLRHRFTDGSSLASTPQSVAITTGRCAITTIPVNPAGRTDYAGWTLERTALGGTAAGPFQWVADGTATSYNDDFADSDLGYVSSELYHGGAPEHFAGMIYHAGRLFGWAGSTLYASQVVGDVEATGLCNWDARNAYDFAKEDGTEIRSVERQGNRLVILKDRKVMALEGSDLDSFSVVPLHDGAGAAGPRCSASMGNVVWFLGKAGLHRLTGNKVVPIGWVEVGDLYRTAFSDALLHKAVLRNHLSQRLLVAFSQDGVRNGDMVVYDMRFDQWARWTNIYAADLLVPSVTDFGSREAFLYLDSRDRATNDFRPMIGFHGAKDEKAANGTGGVAITCRITPPDLDNGAPDTTKMTTRVAMLGRGSDLNLTCTVTILPTKISASVQMRSTATGSKWGAEKWGASKWAGATEIAEKPLGLPVGMIGTRYRLEIVMTDTTGDSSFRGIVVDGIVLPQRRLS